MMEGDGLREFVKVPESWTAGSPLSDRWPRDKFSTIKILSCMLQNFATDSANQVHQSEFKRAEIQLS